MRSWLYVCLVLVSNATYPSETEMMTALDRARSHLSSHETDSVDVCKQSLQICRDRSIGLVDEMSTVCNQREDSIECHRLTMKMLSSFWLSVNEYAHVTRKARSALSSTAVSWLSSAEGSISYAVLVNKKGSRYSASVSRIRDTLIKMKHLESEVNAEADVCKEPIKPERKNDSKEEQQANEIFLKKREKSKFIWMVGSFLFLVSLFTILICKRRTNI